MAVSNGTFDCAIRNGLVVDGTGCAPYRADVAIRGERIVAVGKVGPFALNPSYLAMAHSPLEERLAELRKPEMRAKLLSETPTDPTPPNYEPSRESSMVAEAKRRGLSPEEVIYDRLLEDDGRALLFVAAGSYGHGTLDSVHTLLEHPNTIYGLGDGGAHYGVICDASHPTFMLTHWTRDRQGMRIPLPSHQRALCRASAPAGSL